MKNATAHANEASGATVPRRWPQRSPRRPTSSSTAALAAGMAISSQARLNSPPAGAVSSGIVVPSELQQVRVVDRGRPAGPEDGHDDGQADHDLGRGDHHHEEGRDLAVEGTVDPGE